ncbi:undecaprenyl-diphosphatase UppP [Desulfogranum japonicum]|uniref:undecaprenyl-diphosphatase UppP n=1 Tax=Desulfogranum japonicum TaxID=231447 RepID=UPI0004048F28|nr:undecaprenyl-diphosphatase UppP [Desulfogranum japonicum]
MEIIKAIILGVVQGLTEFLPISSSGHLVIGSEILNFHELGIAFEVFLHLGTLLAVLIAFYKDILLMLRALFVSPETRRSDPQLRRAFMWDIYIVIATIPAVIVGLFLKDSIDAIFDNILITYGMLAVTGTIMLLTRRIKDRDVQINAPRSVVIGCAQAIAILPGLSRSGSTIFTGMLLGVQRETAARFSFIMSIPAILGAGVLKLSDLIAVPPAREQVVALGIGTIASIVSGYLAILCLMRFVRRGQLHWFGYYCYVVSALGFLHYFMS